MNILMAHNYYAISGGEDVSYRSEKYILEQNGNNVVSYEADSSEISKNSNVKNAINSIWNQKTYDQVTNLIRESDIEIAHFQNTFPILSPSVYYAARNLNVPVIQSLRNYRLTCVNGLLFREGNICTLCVGKSFPIYGIKNKCYRDDARASAVVAASSVIHSNLGTYKNVVDKYIAVSNFVKDLYISSGLPEEKIFVKPNVVAGEVPIGLGNGNYFLYVGRLSEEKGIMHLIESFLRNEIFYPLKIIGDGPLVEVIIQMCNMTDKIEYLGRLPIESVYNFMGSAKAVIVPSLWHEPFGRVVIESYAVGTPVIGSSKGGITELIHHGYTGMLYGEDPNAIFNVISEFLIADAAPNEMRDNCRNEYEKHYSEKANYKILRRIYNE